MCEGLQVLVSYTKIIIFIDTSIEIITIFDYHTDLPRNFFDFQIMLIVIQVKLYKNK